MPADPWDSAQREIIFSDGTARLLVEAGPGTGKTAVACARVAHLIENEDVEPSNVWLFSFTRTAVREIRDRIQQYVTNPKVALAVRITTLDSRVWHLRQGFSDDDVRPTGEASYRLNIEDILNRLRDRDHALIDYLADVEHLIVDEAQDLVGLRGELVCELIKVLDPQCGITVFSDIAQGIYGFTTENGNGGAENYFNAVVEIERFKEFSKKQLTTVYRTNDAELARAWEELRRAVLSFGSADINSLEYLQDKISHLAHGSVPPARQQDLDGRADILVLYRTRGNVLAASSWLWSNKIPHKLRMSGLPERLTPWIARVFCDFTDSTISEAKFSEIWSARVPPTMFDEADREHGWAALRYYCGVGRNSVDVRRMRQRLSVTRPPIEFILPDEKLPGPVLGTIHASKGREAPHVHLMLTNVRKTDDAQQLAEEARVLFVGATRSRESLRIGRIPSRYCRYTEGSRRMFEFSKRYVAAQTELGRKDDLDRSAALDTNEWPDGEEGAHKVQEYLWKHCLTPKDLYAEMSADTDWQYWLHDSDGLCDWIGRLSQNLKRDLWDIGKAVATYKKKKRLRPGGKIKFITMTGSASVVLPLEDESVHRLIAPHNETGIFLVPTIFAFTNVYFNSYRSRKKA